MPQWLEPLPVVLLVDVLRYAIPVSLAFTIFWVWKWDALEHRRIQKRRPSRNAFHREILYSLSTILIFTAIGVATQDLHRAGALRLYDDVSTYGWAYWVASIGAAILIHDAYFYWTHRAMHHPKLFARFHRVHHLSTSPSPWASYSFAPLEAVVEGMVVPLTLLVMPMHQLAVFVFLVYMIAINVLSHLGIELFPRSFTRSRWTRWLVTSTHHNLHHRDFHGNYGLYFTWWDRLLGTQHAQYHETFAALTGAPANTGTPRDSYQTPVV